MTGWQGSDRSDDFFACVRCVGAWRQVVAEEEGDLGFESAIAPLRAGEQGSGGCDPDPGQGRKRGRGVGVGRADLPAADAVFRRGVSLGDEVLDEVDLVHGGGAQFDGKVVDEDAGTAGVEQDVRGFDQLGFALSGGFDHGVSLLDTVMRRSQVSPMGVGSVLSQGAIDEMRGLWVSSCVDTPCGRDFRGNGVEL